MHNAHHYSHHNERWLTSHDESKNSDHCQGEFSRAKAKEKVLVPRRQNTQNKIIRAGQATSHSPPHYKSPKPTRPLHPKSTPAILLSPIAGASLRFWQRSGRGISLVHATAKPES